MTFRQVVGASLDVVLPSMLLGSVELSVVVAKAQRFSLSHWERVRVRA